MPTHNLPPPQSKTAYCMGLLLVTCRERRTGYMLVRPRLRAKRTLTRLSPHTLSLPFIIDWPSLANTKEEEEALVFGGGRQSRISGAFSCNFVRNRFTNSAGRAHSTQFHGTFYTKYASPIGGQHALSLHNTLAALACFTFPATTPRHFHTGAGTLEERSANNSHALCHIFEALPWTPS